MEKPMMGIKETLYTRTKLGGLWTCGLTVHTVKFCNSDIGGELILRQKLTLAHAKKRNSEQTVKCRWPDEAFLG